MRPLPLAFLALVAGLGLSTLLTSQTLAVSAGVASVVGR